MFLMLQTLLAVSPVDVIGAVDWDAVARYTVPGLFAWAGGRTAGGKWKKRVDAHLVDGALHNRRPTDVEGIVP